MLAARALTGGSRDIAGVGGWLNADAKAIDSYAMGRGVTPDRPSTVSYEPYPGVFTPPFHYANPVTGQTGARQ